MILCNIDLSCVCTLKIFTTETFIVTVVTDDVGLAAISYTLITHGVVTLGGDGDEGVHRGDDGECVD